MIDRENILALLFFLGVTFIVSLIGNIATRSSVNDWFLTLTEPPYNPPRWMIPVAWVLIYIMIAFSGFLVWQQKENYPVLPIMTVFGLQLVLNALWPVLFFGLQKIGWAFVEICFLWLSVVVYIVWSWTISRTASCLFMPYALWLTYAGYLNIMYWLLN